MKNVTNNEMIEVLFKITEQLDALKEKMGVIKKNIDKQFNLAKNVLTLTEACEYLQLSSSHLYKLTAQNEIPHYKPNGKKIYFDKRNLKNGSFEIAIRLMKKLV